MFWCLVHSALEVRWGEVKWGYFMTDGQSISMSWCRAPLWDLQPDITRTSCRNVALWNLRSCLWREDGSAICSVITQWSGSRKIRNHTLLSHPRLLQPGGPGSRIYIPPRSEVWGLVTTNGQSVSMSWRRAILGTYDQILILFEFRCVVFVGRPLWREVGSVSCQSAIIVHCQFFSFVFVCWFVFSPHFTRHIFYVYTIHPRPSQPRLSTADLAPSFVASTTTAV
jgi:hypothetical protein